MARMRMVSLLVSGSLVLGLTARVSGVQVTVRFREGGGSGYINLKWDAVSIHPPADQTYQTEEYPDWTRYHLRASGQPASRNFYVLMGIKDLLAELPVTSSDIATATLTIVGDMGDGDTCILFRLTTDWLSDPPGQNESDTTSQYADASSATEWAIGSFSPNDYDTSESATYKWPASGTYLHPTPFDVTQMVKDMYDAGAAYGFCLTNYQTDDQNIIPMNPAGTNTNNNAILEIVYSDASTYALTVDAGSGGGTYAPGTQVAISANPPDSGYLWSVWTGDTAWVYVPDDSDTILEMPSHSASVTATYVIARILTVNSGTGSGAYKEGAVVAIEADTPTTGTIFDQWVGDTGHVASTTSRSTSVTMPASNVEVTATYTHDPDFYFLTVNSGSGSGLYQWGSIVAISADPPGTADYIFKCWIGDTGTIDDMDGASTTITIPQFDPVITATYKWTPYTLRIYDGKRMSRYPPSPGEVVPIAADVPPSGQVFAEWTGDTDAVDDVFAMYTTLTMPASDQEVTATFTADVVRGFRIKFREGGQSGYVNTPFDDTWIELDPPNDVAHGHEENMEIVDGTYANQETHEHASLICMKDLFTQLPGSSGGVPIMINSAFLSLYRYNGPKDTPFTIARVLTDWVVDDAGTNEQDCSGWYCENSTYTVWAGFTAFGPLDYDGDGALQAYIQKDTENSEQKYDITPLIRDIYACGYNCGLGLIGAPDFVSTDPEYEGISLRTSEYEQVGARPSFQIDYQYGYILTVNSGTGGGVYPEGAIVPIAADPPLTGKQFQQWIGDTGCVADTLGSSTSVTIPEGDVEVTATYTDAFYTLTVNSGTGGGSYLMDEVVEISADTPPTGEQFLEWTGDTGFLASTTSQSTTVTIPPLEIEVTATYTDIVYVLTVTNGTGSGQYAEGAVVEISANPPPSGKAFAIWMGDVACVADRYAPDTTVTMPSSDVSVTAAYAYTYTLTVNSGSGGGDYFAGEVVPIVADSPPTDTEFVEWIGDTAHIDDSSQSSTSVTMPALDVELTATYRDLYWDGDLNHDFFVGQGDLDIVLDQWGNSGGEITDQRADVNEDDFVGQTDLDYVLDDWGKSGGPP